MTAFSIQPTYPIFTDIDGQPLESGYIWIGTENLDPQVNPINVYWDADLTILAQQPIRTLAGYPSRNGSPGRLYVNGDYSIRVMNRNGSVVYSAPSATERYDLNVIIGAIDADQVAFTPYGGVIADNVQDAIEELADEKVSFTRLDDSDGATLVGSSGGITVQAALSSRPTSATLAASTGAASIGASGWGTVQSGLDTISASQTSGVLGYATKNDMDNDLNHPAQTVAYVLNDPTVAYNGIYRKTGASGTGSWIIQSNPYVIQGGVSEFSGISNNDYTIMPFVPNGRYIGVGTITGAFKIKLPVSKTGTFMAMTVEIMDQYGRVNLQISGTNANPSWAYTTAFSSLTNQFNSNPSVRFGNDGTTDCVWIGETTSSWEAPQIWISQVNLGSNGYTAAWLGNWTLSVVGSFDTVDTTIVPSQVVPVEIPRQFSPTGGLFSGGAGDTTGAFKIRLPVRNTSSFISFVVKIMDVYGFREYLISGSNASSWNYTRAFVNGSGLLNVELPIRWGNDGTYDCVWIGDTSTTSWAFPEVFVTDVEIGSAGSTNPGWLNDWDVTLVTSFDTVTAGPTTPTVPLVAGQPINGGTVSFPVSPGGTYLGYRAGAQSPGNGTYNTFVGYECGYQCTTGYNNAFGGLQTGAACTTGYANSGWGLQVLQYLTTGAFNSGYGIHALLGLETGIANTAVGGGSMQYLISGSNNTAIGMYAGRDVTGSNNVFIGNRSGQGNTAINNRLYIANNETTTLIYGEFDNQKVVIDGTLTTDQYILSDLNVAPASATATGTKGEIRVTANYIYVCTATNTWVRAALSTW